MAPNRLLQVISEDELRKLLYVEAMSPNEIGRLHGCSRYIVAKAIAICDIQLDRGIWRSGASRRQRQVALSGIKLTDRQDQILVGGLLGDGRIGGIRGACYSISQCAKHKEYLEWLADELEPFSAPIIESNKLPKASSKVYLGYRLYTICHSEFMRYRVLFYPAGKKIVPLGIEELLTPLSVAVWYCEDGYSHDRWRKSVLCTCGFTDVEVRLLIDALYKRLNVKAHLRYMNRRKQYPIIRIGAEGYDVFHDVVDPFVSQFTCFHHKLGRKKGLRKVSRYRGELVHSSKLTAEQVCVIRRLSGGSISNKELASKYGVSMIRIQNVVVKKTWKHVE